MEESSTSNQLGESYVADIHHSSKHAPFHCTNVEECKYLTNHFNEQLNTKVFNTFKNLCSNLNLDSIQETYPKNSIHNKIIMQFVEETNLKYSFDLKFTELEAPEVGLWVKIFQVAGHDEDQQLPKQLALPQQLEPPNNTHINIHSNKHTKQHYLQRSCHLPNSRWKLTN